MAYSDANGKVLFSQTYNLFSNNVILCFRCSFTKFSAIDAHLLGA